MTSAFRFPQPGADFEASLWDPAWRPADPLVAWLELRLEPYWRACRVRRPPQAAPGAPRREAVRRREAPCARATEAAGSGDAPAAAAFLVLRGPGKSG